MFPSRRIAISGGDKFRDEHSLTFDGSDDYISAGDITIVDGLDDFSLGVWVKYLDDSSQSFIDKGGYAGVGAAFGGYYNEGVDSGRWRFAIDDGLYFYYNAAAQYLPQNQWHHTVVTYSNTNDRIFFYFNGIQITPTTNVGTYKAVPSTNHPVKIGINGSSYSNEDGEVNVMIAPVKTMVGDTATIFYGYYDNWKEEETYGEFYVIFD